MNKEQVMADIKEGLRQSAAGEVVDLGDFRQYATSEGTGTTFGPFEQTRTEGPQGEPSDAQVLAALEAYWGVGGSWSRPQIEKMRAALRAAGTQGEPSDEQEVERLRGQIEEARSAWWSATEQGDNGLIYTDKIEDAMDDIWSAIGHADWTPKE